MSRDAAISLALGALAGASLVSSVGAWILLWRERRRSRPRRHPHHAGPQRPSP